MGIIVPVRDSLLVIILFVMWPSCHADVCCFPKQLEGQLSMLYSRATGSDLFTEINMDVSFDWTNKRIREYIPATGYLQLLFFGKGVGYFIKNSTCQVQKLSPLSDSEFCVPDRAKRMKSYTIGLKEKMTFTDYVFSPVKKGTIGQQIRTITDDCVPVVDIYFMNRNNYFEMVTYSYQNITPGIKDEKVFNVPSFCKSSVQRIGNTHAEEKTVFWNSFGFKDNSLV